MLGLGFRSHVLPVASEQELKKMTYSNLDYFNILLLSYFDIFTAENQLKELLNVDINTQRVLVEVVRAASDCLRGKGFDPSLRLQQVLWGAPPCRAKQD